MKFGDYLKKVREEKRWTQPTAAQRIGIEQSYLSKLETGKSYPAEDTFDRLVNALGIDVDEMTQLVESDELQKLRDLKSVRVAILDQHRKAVSFSRKWMITGLIGLMLAGASIGAALVPTPTERQYLYRSQGILKPQEPLTAFDQIYSNDESRRTKMLERLDQSDRILDRYRGESFVETSPEGRRFYKLSTHIESNNRSSMQYFIIPGLMFLFGSLGCFLNVFKWGH